MKVCHCTLPTLNPDACKNCSNNQDIVELDKPYAVPEFNKEDLDILTKKLKGEIN